MTPPTGGHPAPVPETAGESNTIVSQERTLDQIWEDRRQFHQMVWTAIAEYRQDRLAESLKHVRTRPRLK